VNPQRYCEEQVAAAGSSLYYAFRFLPPARREAVTALYAFCREVGDVVNECSDPGVARLKLDWWRGETERVFSGDARHPVGQALQPLVERHGLAQEYFMEIIDGVEMSLTRPRHASFRELSLYCYRTAGVVGILAAQIFGYRHRDTIRHAIDMGTALQLTHIIRNLREDARRGRIYIPRDELERFGVDSGRLLECRPSGDFRGLMRFQAERARAYYRRALDELPPEDRHAQCAGLALGAIRMATLDEIERDGFAVMERRVALTPLRKLWIAWRTVRRAQRHHAPLASTGT
jgi:phytoene synthase